MTRTTDSKPLSRSDGLALGLIATGAVAVGIAALASVVGAAITTTQRTVTVTGVALVDAPMDTPAGATAAAYETASISLPDASALVRWLLFSEGALPALATIGTCAIAAWLGVRLIRSRPFAARVDAAIAAVACLVMVGGIGGQLAGALGRAETTALLERADPEAGSVFYTFLLNLDLAPIGWGFVLALVAAVFGIGRRLQRDTEGLV